MASPMRTVCLCLLFGALLATAAPAVPVWPSSYLVEGKLDMLPVGFNKITFENVTIYFDSNYGGLQSYDDYEHYIIQSFAANASFEVMAADNQYMCIVTQGGGGPSVRQVHAHMLSAAPNSQIVIQPGLPPTTNFTYMGEMVCPDKKEAVCYHFQKVESESSGKVNNYELYMFQDGTPYRYEWLGYDELFGSHFDHYVFTYKKYIPNYSNPSLLTTPSICANQTAEEKFPEKWQKGETAAHAVHKSLHSEAHSAFRAFTRTYNKKYPHMDEYNTRLLQHTRNMEYVNSHNNNGKKTFKLKINHMGDLHQDEMRMRMGLLGKPDLSGAKTVFEHDPNVKIPDSVDWREQNYVSPVKDQGICGSCWAFSTTGALEGQYAKAKGSMIILSQQFLVDCAWNGNMGCDGGFQNLAYDYLQAAGGAPLAVNYGEYKMVNEMCHYNNNSAAVQIMGYTAIQSGNETALAQASAVAGPIAISIDAGHMEFVFYDSGVYYNPACSSVNLDHAVLLIGYGVENGTDYWLVKNSWSTFWGDFGYVKMARNHDNNCGVATGALFPIVV